MIFIKENFNHKVYLVFLAASVLIYFAATRLLQDLLYKSLELGRPKNMFESLGSFFARPEPLEIPLYLVGFLIVPLVAFVLYYLWERKFIKYFYWFAGILAGVVLVKFLPGVTGHIPPLAAYFAYIEEHGIGKALWLLFTKRIFVARLMLSMSAIVFLIVYFTNFGVERLKSYSSLPIWKKFEPVFIILLLFLIFHPNFPTQDHHYNYYIGPINDIFSGKPLLYETTHLYGLLDIYFLLPIFKYVLPTSYVSLNVVLQGFYIAFFLGLYFFLRSWLNSRFYGYLGTLTALAVFYFFNSSPTRSIFFFPADSPLRSGLYLLVLFFLLAHSRQPKAVYRELSIITAVVSLFWNFDSGTFLAAATFITLAYLQSFSFKRMSLLALKFLGYAAFVFGAISVVNFSIYGSAPSWQLFFKEIAPFTVGIGMTPLPVVGIFEFFVFIYLALGLWIIRDHLRGKTHDPTLVFLILWGIFSSLFYIGQSSWQVLTYISTPPILLILYLFRNFPDLRVISSVFISLLTFAFLIFIVKIPIEFSNRNYSEIKSLSAVERGTEDLYADAEYLKKNFSELERLPLLHLHDTRLLTLTARANYFDFYYLFTRYYHEEVEALAEQVKKERPEYLFIGRDHDDRIELFASLTLENYDHVRSLKTLKIYKIKQQN